MQEIPREQAKQILITHTTINSNYSGKKGMKKILDHLGSIQLDTLPIVGRNHDLILQARMKDYKVDQFLDLAHEKRWGFEHYDRNLAMISMDHFPLTYAWMKLGGDRYYLAREKRLREKYPEAFMEILSLLKEHESVSSKEIETGSVSSTGYDGWKASKVGAAVLDCLWNRGETFIHHRESYRRFYSLPENRISSEYFEIERPETKEEFCKQLLFRRINEIGLASLSWQPKCSRPFVKELVEAGKILEVKIAGGAQKYLTTRGIIENTESNDIISDSRVRFLAPLDPLIWDRKMTLDIFDFEYVWEVYKPVKDRVWGYYLLPVFFENEFLGRIDVKLDRNTNILQIKRGYWEPKSRPTSSLLKNIANELGRFCTYLGTNQVEYTAKDKFWKKICEQSAMII